MVDYFIDTLSLRINGGVRHEHRVEPIARQAAVLFASRLRELARSDAGHNLHIPELAAPRQQLDLTTLTDAEAAGQIASAWLDAIAPAVTTAGGARPFRK